MWWIVAGALAAGFFVGGCTASGIMAPEIDAARSEATELRRVHESVRANMERHIQAIQELLADLTR